MRESFKFGSPANRHENRTEKHPEKLPDNVSVLDLPEARYRFLYEHHQLTHSPRELGNAEVLVLEIMQVADYSNPQVATDEFARIFEGNLQRRVLPDKETAYENVIKFEAYLEARKIPQYLIDVVDPRSEYIHLLEKAQILLNTEGAVGGVASGYLAARALDKGVSRRSFLAGLAAVALVGKQATNMVNNNPGEDASNKKRSPGAKVVQQINETINPELPGIMVKYRNAIWAIKLHRLAKELTEHNGGKKPEIAMQLGGNHAGIEEMLQADPKDVLDYIKKTSQILSKFVHFGPDGVMISPMAKLEYNENTQKWEASEAGKDMDLEAIEKTLNQ